MEANVSTSASGANAGCRGAPCLARPLPDIRLNFERDAIPAHELVAWLGARYQLRDITFQEPEIEDVIRRIYEQGLLLSANPA